MSFRLFVYYCALGGGGGALGGWALGRLLHGATPLLDAGLKAMLVGMPVALALSLLDALWNLSLRQVALLVQRVVAAVLVGGFGGFFGGLLGHSLAGLPAPVGAGLGWALGGLMIGAAPGTFDVMVSLSGGQSVRGPARKVLNGVLGGAAGGFLGGVLLAGLSNLWGGVFESREADRLWSPGATGLAALGASVGLLAGLAQVFLRDAWLRIEKGPRAGRELILTKPVVTVGRSQGCDVGLVGDGNVERVHARLTRQGDQYVVSDAGSASGTYVNGERVGGPRPLRGGDAITVGDCVLRFGERRGRR